MYQSAQRLSLRLFGTTHATSYMRTVTDQLFNMWRASPLERLVIERYCFTTKTEGGKNVGVDFHMEKYVNIVRDETNKNFKRGHLKTIEHATIVRLDQVKAGGIKGSTEEFRDGNYMLQDRTDYFCGDALVFAFVSVLLEDSGIWDATSDTGNENQDGKLRSARDGCEQNARILNAQSIGADATDKYCTKFMIENPNQVYRSEKEMDIPAIPSTSKQETTLLNKALERATSLNEEVLAKVPGLGTKADLCDELKKLERFLPTRDNLTINPEKFSKKAIAKKLVSVRKVAFATVDTARTEIEQAVRTTYSTTTTQASRTTELENNKYYTFEGCSFWNHPAIQQNYEFSEQDL